MSQSGIRNTTGYVNYVYNLSARGSAQVLSNIAGMSGQVGSMLGQLAFQTQSVLSATEGTIVALGTAAVAGFTEATKRAMEFDYAMKEVRAIAGKDANIGAINSQAVQLSNQYGMALSDVTDGLITLGRAGLKGDSMTKVLQEGFKLSKLEALDLNYALESLISTTNLLDTKGISMNDEEYGKAVEEMNNLIVSTSEVSPLDARDIINTMQHAGGYVQTTGMDQKDVFAVIAQLGSVGTKGEIAGTALRAFMSAGQKDTGQRALERIGLNVNDLWGANGETMMSITDMKDLIDSQMEAKGYSKQEKLEFYSDFVGYKQANQIMKIDTDSVAQYREEMDKSESVTEKVSILLGTAQQNLKSIAQIAGNFLMKVGSNTLKFLNPALVVVKTLLDFITSIPGIDILGGFALATLSVKALATIFNKIIPLTLGQENRVERISTKTTILGKGVDHIKNSITDIRSELSTSYSLVKAIATQDWKVIDEESLKVKMGIDDLSSSNKKDQKSTQKEEKTEKIIKEEKKQPTEQKSNIERNREQQKNYTTQFTQIFTFLTSIQDINQKTQNYISEYGGKIVVAVEQINDKISQILTTIDPLGKKRNKITAGYDYQPRSNTSSDVTILPNFRQTPTINPSTTSCMISVDPNSIPKVFERRDDRAIGSNVVNEILRQSGVRNKYAANIIANSIGITDSNSNLSMDDIIKQMGNIPKGEAHIKIAQGIRTYYKHEEEMARKILPIVDSLKGSISGGKGDMAIDDILKQLDIPYNNLSILEKKIKLSDIAREDSKAQKLIKKAYKNPDNRVQEHNRIFAPTEINADKFDFTKTYTSPLRKQKIYDITNSTKDSNLTVEDIREKHRAIKEDRQKGILDKDNAAYKLGFQIENFDKLVSFEKIITQAQDGKKVVTIIPSIDTRMLKIPKEFGIIGQQIQNTFDNVINTLEYKGYKGAEGYKIEGMEGRINDMMNKLFSPAFLGKDIAAIQNSTSVYNPDILSLLKRAMQGKAIGGQTFRADLNKLLTEGKMSETEYHNIIDLFDEAEKTSAGDFQTAVKQVLREYDSAGRVRMTKEGDRYVYRTGEGKNLPDVNNPGRYAYVGSEKTKNQKISTGDKVGQVATQDYVLNEAYAYQGKFGDNSFLYHQMNELVKMLMHYAYREAHKEAEAHRSVGEVAYVEGGRKRRQLKYKDMYPGVFPRGGHPDEQSINLRLKGRKADMRSSYTDKDEIVDYYPLEEWNVIDPHGRQIGQSKDKYQIFTDGVNSIQIKKRIRKEELEKDQAEEKDLAERMREVFFSDSDRLTSQDENSDNEKFIPQKNNKWEAIYSKLAVPQELLRANREELRFNAGSKIMDEPINLIQRNVHRGGADGTVMGKHMADWNRYILAAMEEKLTPDAFKRAIKGNDLSNMVANDAALDFSDYLDQVTEETVAAADFINNSLSETFVSILEGGIRQEIKNLDKEIIQRKMNPSLGSVGGVQVHTDNYTIAGQYNENVIEDTENFYNALDDSVSDLVGGDYITGMNDYLDQKVMDESIGEFTGVSKPELISAIFDESNNDIAKLEKKVLKKESELKDLEDAFASLPSSIRASLVPDELLDIKKWRLGDVNPYDFIVREPTNNSLMQYRSPGLDVMRMHNVRRNSVELATNIFRRDMRSKGVFEGNFNRYLNDFVHSTEGEQLLDQLIQENTFEWNPEKQSEKDISTLQVLSSTHFQKTIGEEEYQQMLKNKQLAPEVNGLSPTVIKKGKNSYVVPKMERAIFNQEDLKNESVMIQIAQAEKILTEITKDSPQTAKMLQDYFEGRVSSVKAYDNNFINVPEYINKYKKMLNAKSKFKGKVDLSLQNKNQQFLDAMMLDLAQDKRVKLSSEIEELILSGKAMYNYSGQDINSMSDGELLENTNVAQDLKQVSVKTYDQIKNGDLSLEQGLAQNGMYTSNNQNFSIKTLQDVVDLTGIDYLKEKSNKGEPLLNTVLSNISSMANIIREESKGTRELDIYTFLDKYQKILHQKGYTMKDVNDALDNDDTNKKLDEMVTAVLSDKRVKPHANVKPVVNYDADLNERLDDTFLDTVNYDRDITPFEEMSDLDVIMKSNVGRQRWGDFVANMTKIKRKNPHIYKAISRGHYNNPIELLSEDPSAENVQEILNLNPKLAASMLSTPQDFHKQNLKNFELLHMADSFKMFESKEQIDLLKGYVHFDEKKGMYTISKTVDEVQKYSEVLSVLFKKNINIFDIISKANKKLYRAVQSVTDKSKRGSITAESLNALINDFTPSLDQEEELDSAYTPTDGMTKKERRKLAVQKQVAIYMLQNPKEHENTSGELAKDRFDYISSKITEKHSPEYLKARYKELKDSIPQIENARSTGINQGELLRIQAEMKAIQKELAMIDSYERQKTNTKKGVQIPGVEGVTILKDKESKSPTEQLIEKIAKGGPAGPGHFIGAMAKVQNQSKDENINLSREFSEYQSGKKISDDNIFSEGEKYAKYGDLGKKVYDAHIKVSNMFSKGISKIFGEYSDSQNINSQKPGLISNFFNRKEKETKQKINSEETYEDKKGTHKNVLIRNEQLTASVKKLGDKLEKTRNTVSGVTSAFMDLSQAFPPLYVVAVALEGVMGGLSLAMSIHSGIIELLNVQTQVLNGATMITIGEFTVLKDSLKGSILMTLSDIVGGVGSMFSNFVKLLLPFKLYIAAAAIAITALIGALKWSESSHQAYVDKLKEESKTRASASAAASENLKALKKKQENPHNNQYEQDKIDKKVALANDKLKSNNMKRITTGMEMGNAENDILWGQYGVRASFQKSLGKVPLIGGLFGGEYESTSENYDRTSSNTRAIVEHTVNNPFASAAERQVASYYNANASQFGVLEQYKNDFIKLYDKESSLVKKEGSTEAARSTDKWNKIISDFEESTGINRKQAEKYLDYMQTEHNVDQAKSAMKTQGDTIVADADMKATAIAMGGNVNDVLGLNGIEAQQKALVKANADMLQEEVSTNLWWKAVWASIESFFWAIMSPITLIVNIVSLLSWLVTNLPTIIYAGTIGNIGSPIGLGLGEEDKQKMAEGTRLAKNVESSMFDIVGGGKAGQKAGTYWNAWAQNATTDYESIGNEAIDPSDRAGSPSDTGFGYTNNLLDKSSDASQEPKNINNQQTQNNGLNTYAWIREKTGNILPMSKQDEQQVNNQKAYQQQLDSQIKESEVIKGSDSEGIWTIVDVLNKIYDLINIIGLGQMLGGLAGFVAPMILGGGSGGAGGNIFTGGLGNILPTILGSKKGGALNNKITDIGKGAYNKASKAYGWGKDKIGDAYTRVYNWGDLYGHMFYNKHRGTIDNIRATKWSDAYSWGKDKIKGGYDWGKSKVSDAYDYVTGFNTGIPHSWGGIGEGIYNKASGIYGWGRDKIKGGYNRIKRFFKPSASVDTKTMTDDAQNRKKISIVDASSNMESVATTNAQNRKKINIIGSVDGTISDIPIKHRKKSKNPHIQDKSITNIEAQRNFIGNLTTSHSNSNMESVATTNAQNTSGKVYRGNVTPVPWVYPSYSPLTFKEEMPGATEADSLILPINEDESRFSVREMGGGIRSKVSSARDFFNQPISDQINRILYGKSRKPSSNNTLHTYMGKTNPRIQNEYFKTKKTIEKKKTLTPQEKINQDKIDWQTGALTGNNTALTVARMNAKKEMPNEDIYSENRRGMLTFVPSYAAGLINRRKTKGTNDKTKAKSQHKRKRTPSDFPHWWAEDFLPQDVKDNMRVAKGKPLHTYMAKTRPVALQAYKREKAFMETHKEGIVKQRHDEIKRSKYYHAEDKILNPQAALLKNKYMGIEEVDKSLTGRIKTSFAKLKTNIETSSIWNRISNIFSRENAIKASNAIRTYGKKAWDEATRFGGFAKQAYNERGIIGGTAASGRYLQYSAGIGAGDLIAGTARKLKTNKLKQLSEMGIRYDEDNPQGWMSTMGKYGKFKARQKMGKSLGYEDWEIKNMGFGKLTKEYLKNGMSQAKDKISNIPSSIRKYRKNSNVSVTGSVKTGLGRIKGGINKIRTFDEWGEDYGTQMADKYETKREELYNDVYPDGVDIDLDDIRSVSKKKKDKKKKGKKGKKSKGKSKGHSRSNRSDRLMFDMLSGRHFATTGGILPVSEDSFFMESDAGAAYEDASVMDYFDEYDVLDGVEEYKESNKKDKSDKGKSGDKNKSKDKGKNKGKGKGKGEKGIAKGLGKGVGKAGAKLGAKGLLKSGAKLGLTALGTGGGWAAGAALGATLGSIVPGLGTAVGGFVGGMLGLAAEGMLMDAAIDFLFDPIGSLKGVGNAIGGVGAAIGLGGGSSHKRKDTNKLPSKGNSKGGQSSKKSKKDKKDKKGADPLGALWGLTLPGVVQKAMEDPLGALWGITPLGFADTMLGGGVGDSIKSVGSSIAGFFGLGSEDGQSGGNRDKNKLQNTKEDNAKKVFDVAKFAQKGNRRARDALLAPSKFVDNLTGGMLSKTRDKIYNTEIGGVSLKKVADATGLTKTKNNMSKILFGDENAEDSKKGKKDKQTAKADNTTVAEDGDKKARDTANATSKSLENSKNKIFDTSTQSRSLKNIDKNTQEGNSSTVIIENININTNDDPESMKTALMNLVIELQEQTSPRMVSRTVGEPPSSGTSTQDATEENSEEDETDKEKSEDK